MAEQAPSDHSMSDYMQDLVLEMPDVEAFLNELARFSARKLTDSENEVLCGITLRRNRRSSTVASSSELAQQMDEVQYAFGAGPCMSASYEHQTISVPDLRTEERWPRYTKAVLEHGIRSVLAVPFALDGQNEAALNLYSTEANKFDDEIISRVEQYTAQASKALRLAVKIGQHLDNATNLKAAMESRTTIDLAVGVIMGQNRCSQEAAVALIKSASSSRNIKLRDVAAQILSTTTGSADTRTHFDHSS